MDDERQPWDGYTFYIMIWQVILSAEEISGVWIA
jgi:hypothetical protein